MAIVPVRMGFGPDGRCDNAALGPLDIRRRRRGMVRTSLRCRLSWGRDAVRDRGEIMARRCPQHPQASGGAEEVGRCCRTQMDAGSGRWIDMFCCGVTSCCTPVFRSVQSPVGSDQSVFRLPDFSLIHPFIHSS